MANNHSVLWTPRSVFRGFVKNIAKLSRTTGLFGVRLGVGLGLLATSSAALGEMTIQIGAFGVAPKPSFTEQASDYGEVLVLQGDDGITRVSIGRYDSKTAARAALAQLQLAGYNDAYITNVRGRGVQPSELASRTSRPAQTTSQDAPRTIVNPVVTASGQRLPSGEQIVAPKQTNPVTDSATAQAGRFRLRTHDTTSGETTDLRVDAGSLPTTAGRSGAVVAGAGANDIPQHLRDKLVYLDGVPHIKEGDQFIPLTDAIDGR